MTSQATVHLNRHPARAPQVNRKGFPVVRYPSAFEMEPLEGWVKYELTREAERVATEA